MSWTDILITSGGTAAATWAAIKVDLWWIKRSLNRLETRLNGTVQEVHELDTRLAIMESRRREADRPLR